MEKLRDDPWREGMTRYFAFVDGASVGPLQNEEDVKSLPGFHSGLLVWPENGAGWVSVALLNGFTQRQSEPERKECPICSEPLPIENAKSCPHCASQTESLIDELQAEMRRKHTETSVFGAAEMGGASGGDPAFERASAESALSEKPFEGDGSPRMRLVTVLFASLDGMSDFSFGNEVEEGREIVNDLFAEMADSVVHFGGWIDKYIGNCLMAVWGIREAQEEDPVRAVTAGLSIISRIRSCADRRDLPFTVRIGINTGEAVFGSVGASANSANTVLGEAVNLASRLCDTAEADQLIAGAQTWRRLGPRFHTITREYELKGIGKTEAYMVSHRLADRQVVRHKVAGSFLARRSELLRLKDAFAGLRSGGSYPGGILVTGYGGTGKSRLCAHALAHYSEGIHVLFSQAAPTEIPAMGAIVSHWISEIIGGSGKESLQEFLSSRPDLSEHRSDLEFILGAGDDGKGLKKAPQERLDQRLVRFLVKLSASAPIIVSVADAQWMDTLSLEVCLGIAAAAEMKLGRIMLLTDGRPSDNAELIEKSRSIATLKLGSLDREGAREFLSEIIADDIPEKWIKTLLNRSGGTILHLNHILDELADQGILAESEAGKWKLSNPEAELPVPRSLFDLLWIRIEKLGTDERNTLMAASVCGSRFPREMILHATGRPDSELSDILGRLEEQSLIQADEREISFEHGSIRESAKRRLLKTEQKKIAERIIDGLGKRIHRSEYQQIIADLFLTAGRADQVLKIRATELHRLLRAWRVDEVRKRISEMEKTIWPDNADGKRARFEYLNARGRLADFDNKMDEADKSYQQSAMIARELEDDSGLAIALGALARSAEVRQDWQAAMKYSEEALNIETKAGNINGRALILSTLARVSDRNKDWDKVNEYCAKGIALNRATGNLRGEVVFLDILGRLAERQKDWDTAQARYEQAYALSDWSRGDPRVQQMNLAALGRVAGRRGEHLKASRCLTASLEIARGMNDRRGIPMRMMELARLSLDARKTQAARTFAEAAMEYGNRNHNNRDVRFAKDLLDRIAGIDANHDSQPTPVDSELITQLRVAADSLTQSPRPLSQIRSEAATLIQPVSDTAVPESEFYWAYIDGKVEGPFSLEKLNRDPRVNETTLVKPGASADWQPLQAARR